LFDIAEILKEFVPAFPEQPRFITAAPVKIHESGVIRKFQLAAPPSFLNLVYIHGLKILVHDCPEGAQKFDDLLLV